jgi:drug/metabolite transporter (DMT)-like permease
MKGLTALGYIMLILATLSWSFVGILVTTASTMLDTSIITFSRFAFGIVFLGVFLLFKDGRIKIRSNLKWIWIGAIGKCCNYWFENIAISEGFAYGNILVPPIQTIVLLIISTLLLKDHFSRKGWVAALLCITGVVVISWNGQSLSLFLESDGRITLFFAISAVGAALHVLSQRMLIKDMDTGNMNFSVFLWCSILMALPLPFQSQGFVGSSSALAWLSVITLGMITGLSFYWFTEAVRRVPFPMIVIISNCSALFTILWSYLFFKEPITWYILSGAFAFLIGLIILNLPGRRVRPD